MATPNSYPLPCDGCGQLASPEHIARRLRRLEWATRHRPVHIRTLFLGAVAPRDDAEYLYSLGAEFRGEAAQLLGVVGISFLGRSAEAARAEFQSAGLFLAHLIECPFEGGGNSAADAGALLRAHLPAVASRIRRSLKPRSVILVTEVPQAVVHDILSTDLGCPVILDQGKPFALCAKAGNQADSTLRKHLLVQEKR
jgi:hypothetical protein